MARSTPTLDFLTPKELKCLALFYFDGMKHKDIAEILGVSRQRVSKYLSRGRKKLAKRRMRPRRVERADEPAILRWGSARLDNLTPDDIRARW